MVPVYPVYGENKQKKLYNSRFKGGQKTIPQMNPVRRLPLDSIQRAGELGKSFFLLLTEVPRLLRLSFQNLLRIEIIPVKFPKLLLRDSIKTV